MAITDNKSDSDCDRVVSDTFHGIIPRVYPSDPRQLAWRWCWQSAPAVLINIGEISTLLAGGTNPHELLGPHQRLVVTGISRNEYVARRTLADTISLLTKVAPVTHIPDAGTVYRADSEMESSGGVRAYGEHLQSLHQAVTRIDAPISLLPLVKGFTSAQLDRLRSIFADFGYDSWAFYTAEYTGAQNGNAVETMRTDLGRAIAQLDPDRVVVIGRGSPAELEKLPPRVRAACTFRQWFDRVRGKRVEDIQKWRRAARQAL